MNFFSIIFHVHDGKKWWQEARDQILHMVYSSALFIIAFYAVSPIEAGLVSFALGYLRELEQHQWKWQEVGKQDLFYWGFASILMTIAFYVIR